MFLSKIELDARRYRNPYQWHKSLWSLFPDFQHDTRPFLFWVSCRERRHQSVLDVLVQSSVKPVSQQGEGLRWCGSKQFQPSPQPGQVLHFRLTANPVKTIADEGGRLNAKSKPKACRVPVVGEQPLKEWLMRKLSPAAELLGDSVVVQPRSPLYFRKADRPGKIVPVDFEGLLSVTEPAALLGLLAEGVGPAKAFGCGLMLVRRC